PGAGENCRRRIRLPPRCHRRATPSFQFNLIILDQRVGEELVGRLVERGVRRFAIGRFDLDVEDFALPHARHARDAERFERAFDRLALRIENAGFEGNRDAGLHRLSCKRGYGANRFDRKPEKRAVRPRAAHASKFTKKCCQCTGATAVCSSSRPRPATWPLSPTSPTPPPNPPSLLPTTG